MRKYPFDQKLRESWKLYPVRISGRSTSSCHSAPTLLVQSMEGGFVTRNCSSCGTHANLPTATFLREIDLWVGCPKCRSKMERDIIDTNYSFKCTACDLYIDLADLLPRWSDL
jgi:endogenous inhibitor of DNA gyrase (YacG/DUF329 family)